MPSEDHVPPRQRSKPPFFHVFCRRRITSPRVNFRSDPGSWEFLHGTSETTRFRRLNPLET
eukprot:1896610-Rhodomonas_salina.1